MSSRKFPAPIAPSKESYPTILQCDATIYLMPLALDNN